jgi:ribonuclease HI
MANIKNLQAPCKPISSGSSGKRTKEQIALARSEAEKIISSFSPNDIIAYTDGGTHKSNPGPCGSGSHLLYPSQDPTNICTPLGWGTNNLGELVAIGCAINHSLLSSPSPGTTIQILTDSQFAQGILVFYWQANAYANLIRIIRRMIEHAKSLNTPVCIHWIAGHAGIAGNEAADAIATLAAEQSVSIAPNVNSLLDSWMRSIPSSNQPHLS